jgi:hypothetical protein
MVIYSMDANPVEPVFYPVVPDSFMNRDSGDRNRRAQPARTGGWKDETDTPFLAPQDRWSF